MRGGGQMRKSLLGVQEKGLRGGNKNTWPFLPEGDFAKQIPEEVTIRRKKRTTVSDLPLDR